MTKKCSIVHTILIHVVSCPRVIRAKHRWILGSSYSDLGEEYAQVRQTRCVPPRVRPSPHRFFTRPGAHFAETSMFLSITGILAMFDIRKYVDENGIEVAPKFEFTTGITRYEFGFASLV